MTQSTYLFDVLDADGETVQHFSQKCTNISAQERTLSLLDELPDAAAVIGAEADGHAVHTAYRE